MRPKLQIALDLQSTQAALDILTPDLVEAVDIVEVGTVLLAAEGAHAIKALRKHIGPEKALVADFKIADAGKMLSRSFFEAGADITTVIAAADLATMRLVHEVAEELGKIAQIELYGKWDWDLAQEWRGTGIQQIIYHQPRDVVANWTDADLEKIKRLNNLGFLVNVTGGVKLDTLERFQNLDVYSFILGRALYQAEHPAAYAKALQDRVTELFG